MIKKVIYSLEEIHLAASAIIDSLAKYKIFAISGSLGAGKTTLIQEVLRELGVKNVVSSPTFTYVNVYQNNKNEKFCHFDLYRLNSPQFFLESGFEEYIYAQENWSFIEWPEIIKNILPKDTTCFVSIEYHGFDKRCLEINK